MYYITIHHSFMYKEEAQRHRAILPACNPPCDSATSCLLHCVAIRVHALGTFPFTGVRVHAVPFLATLT